MENSSSLAVSLILGNHFLIRGQPSESGKISCKRLILRNEPKLAAPKRKRESRWRVCVNNRIKPDEVIQFVEAGARFYQQGGYSSETFSCLVLVRASKPAKG